MLFAFGPAAGATVRQTAPAVPHVKLCQTPPTRGVVPQPLARQFVGQPLQRWSCRTHASHLFEIRCSGSGPVEEPLYTPGAHPLVSERAFASKEDMLEAKRETKNKLMQSNAKIRLDGLNELDNLPAQLALEIIEEVLAECPMELNRSQIMYALINLTRRNENAMRTILRVLAEDKDYSVRAAAAGALGYIEDDSAVEALIRCYAEEVHWLVRYSAIVALGNLKSTRAFGFLKRALDQENVENSTDTLLQQSLISALGEIGSVDAVDAILRFAGSGDFMVRVRVAEALGLLPTEQSLSALKYLEKDSNDYVYGAAAAALKKVTEDLTRSGVPPRPDSPSGSSKV
eukprot:tig00000865_g5071.t1